MIGDDAWGPAWQRQASGRCWTLPPQTPRSAHLRHFWRVSFADSHSAGERDLTAIYIHVWITPKANRAFTGPAVRKRQRRRRAAACPWRSLMGAATSLSVASVVEELASHLLDKVSRPTIHRCVAAAILELRCSISPEALPEMAFRLAWYRLAGATPAVNGTYINGD